MAQRGRLSPFAGLHRSAGEGRLRQGRRRPECRARNTDARLSYGPSLENALFTHLPSKGCSVGVGRIGKLECDFTVRKGDERAYAQVSMTVADSKAEEREYAPFSKICDGWPRHLFTLDPLRSQRDGVRHLNLMEFLRGAETCSSFAPKPSESLPSMLTHANRGGFKPPATIPARETGGQSQGKPRPRGGCAAIPENPDQPRDSRTIRTRQHEEARCGRYGTRRHVADDRRY